MKCKICDGNAEIIFTLKVLNKYHADYFQCNNCDFIQLEQPLWLKEAYGEAISDLDTGILRRNLDLRDIIANIINKNFDSSSKFLDYGGGFGIFVRLMRDKGYDFYRYDKYCKNLFAKYFDIGNDLKEINNKFELLTAFEIFEHLENPLQEIDAMFKLSGTVFFTTELIPKNIKDLREWWYLVPETGQHISFYSNRTLEAIAGKFRVILYTDGFHHIMTGKKINDPFHYKFQKIAGAYKRICNYACREKTNKSLTWQDFEYVKRQAIMEKRK